MKTTIGAFTRMCNTIHFKKKEGVREVLRKKVFE